MALLANGSWAEGTRRTRLVDLCCRNCKKCLHRKFLMTASDSLPNELQNSGLEARDFTRQGGRDLWNQTPLHLAARWSPNETALLLIIQFLGRPNVHQLVNVKDIDGDTFMHILGRRWSKVIRRLRSTIGIISSVLLLAELFETVTDLKSDIINGLSQMSYREVSLALRKSDRFWWEMSITSPMIRYEEVTIQGRTCLMSFIEASQAYGWEMSVVLEILASMLDGLGADVNLRDRDGNTALQYAVRAQLDKVALFLVRSSINVHARNSQNQSVLHLTNVHYQKATRRPSPGLVYDHPDRAERLYARAHSLLAGVFDCLSRPNRQQVDQSLQFIEKLRDAIALADGVQNSSHHTDQSFYLPAESTPGPYELYSTPNPYELDSMAAP
ncbi:hypothetical protein F5Y18DRAFT_428718 [Xylariaceae sp. FL1019]|nr:hypothetical protein F5Y18DRAFT_428718 [Xylariaceae sp. FL1019]